MHLGVTAFHFYIFGYNFLRSTLLKPGNSLSLHHSFLCPGTPCHPTANLQPNPCGTLCEQFQGFRISLLTWHMITSMTSSFIHCYTELNIIRLIQGHIDQYPETQLVKSSYSSFDAHSNLLIYVFSKQFYSLRFLSCIQYLGLISLATKPT
jgi:hypothetical protein